jgi:aminomethyltransferase
MVAFGGWDMPLAYPSGTVAEHRACRQHAVAFDVSHLGTVRVVGSDAFEHLQLSFSNDLRKVHPGRAQYTHLLDEDGSVVDDIIVWWVDEERFDVMPNASNTSSVRGAIGGEDVTQERAVIAIQGPEARDLLLAVSPQAASVHRFSVERFEWEGAPCLVAGTGYTGEDGVECEVPAEAAPPSGTPSWRAACNRRAWAPGTRCASRRAFRCTGTSSGRVSPRCRPG